MGKRVLSAEHRKKLSEAAKKRDYSYLVGKKLSDETKLKISKSNTGRRLGVKHSSLTKIKIAAAHRGKTCKPRFGSEAPNWQGGKTPLLESARHTTEYTGWREAVFSRDDYTCVLCQRRGGHLHADHIEKFADNISLRCEIDNGRTLCRECHYYITFGATLPIGSKWGLLKQKYAS